MNKIINWIWLNKEWIFSGLGALIIAGIFNVSKKTYYFLRNWFQYSTIKSASSSEFNKDIENFLDRIEDKRLKRACRVFLYIIKNRIGNKVKIGFSENISLYEKSKENIHFLFVGYNIKIGDIEAKCKNEKGKTGLWISCYQKAMNTNSILMSRYLYNEILATLNCNSKYDAIEVNKNDLIKLAKKFS